MTDEKQANLIEKIKKLFQMAQKKTNNDGSSNETEAAFAMAKAQELLAKYNLDIRTIENSKAKDGAAVSVGGPREKTRLSNRSAMYVWQQRFWKSLSEMNYCFHWVTTVSEERYHKGHVVTGKRHVILGSQANVTAVQVMGEYLTDEIERLVKIHFPGATTSKSAVSWREGCAERLIQRIRVKMEEMKRSGMKDAAGEVICTALAVQDLHEKEYAANYDATYGAGAYARMKARQAEYEKEAAERQKRADEERERMLGSETPAQRAAREKKEAVEAGKQAAADARAWERYQRRAQRQAARRDMAAYARGFKKANEINLDSQIKEK